MEIFKGRFKKHIEDVLKWSNIYVHTYVGQIKFYFCDIESYRIFLF